MKLILLIKLFVVGHSEQYAFLMPVLKALLDKSRSVLSLTTNVPDLPPTSSGPVFFNDFQMYSTSKQWITFIDNKVILPNISHLKMQFLLLFSFFFFNNIMSFVEFHFIVEKH